MNQRLICLIASAAVMGAAFAANLGYTDGSIGRTNVFREGTTTKQGLAIKLTHDKLAMLKGCSLSGIQAAFGSSRTDGGSAEIFIATDPAGEPLVKSTAAISSAVKWLDLSFDEPYTITGDEPALYVGYTVEIVTTANPLMSDMGDNIPGYSFAYSDGEWIDISPRLVGNASIRAIVPDAPAITDLLLIPTDVSGYYKVGDETRLLARAYNFGTATITSLDVEVTLGEEASQKQTISGVNIQQGESYEIELPAFSASASNDYPIKVEITKVNDIKDMDEADNAFASSMFFYPADMERTVLIEGFTGMSCSNCPTGHQNINSFIASLSEGSAVEVMHHSGYAPDLMTMDADLDYTYFYASASTFAPAVMVNRTAAPTVDPTRPIMNTTVANMQEAYATVSAMQPYVSLSLTTEFDPETRNMKVSVDTYAHTNLPTAVNALNVVLVQDGIEARQEPVGQYTHNAVFRGTLTGNSWGVQLGEGSITAGGHGHWETETVLPEGIFSDYWASQVTTEEQKARYTIDAVPENMHVVAYVAAHGDSPTEMQVYNAVEVALGDSHTQPGYSSVESVIAPEQEIGISISNGHIATSQHCDSVSAFTIDGKQIDASSQLAPGLYIVRAVKAGKIATKKILVR